ncbi:hypothetical protein GHK92_16320 [Nocardioides sp. dk4132]|uniref:hypothetical protein n=1 Tax=unclassified Nocardioides TaxID=2615069 RepID=UPI00129508AD|nr:MULTISPECIES: hypothetical protein [unclassified Nocardioides]MQW77440.1 hypothetical protein [Nocardioides sp. dk4132]QGA09245.1 hypothetical protein GFH29_19005 [Nocardioides sp. dk884]
MPHAVRLLAAAASATLLLSVTACGVAAGPTEQEPAGTWTAQELSAEIGADQAPVLATSGDDALVLAVAEDGTVRSHVSVGGAGFEAGEPLATGATYLQVEAAVVLPDGDWFVLGSGGRGSGNDERLVFEPVGLRSSDGLRWERVDVDGFAHPVEVSDLQVVGDTLVAAGTYRTAADPAMGGFEARIWTSTDAESFTETTPPEVRPAQGSRHESWAGHLAVSGERVLAAGGIDGDAALWVSDDDARSWQRVADPALAVAGSVSGLEVVGGTVALTGSEGSPPALRSTDHGTTWTAVAGLPPAEEVGWAPLWSDHDRFWTLTGIDDMSWSEPEVCYADLAQCGRDPEPRVVTSTDGTDWAAVDLVDVADGPDAVAGTADGRVLVLTVAAHGPVVHTLPAGTTPPVAAAPLEPETVELVTVPHGEPPQVGVRYHAPMYVHCGMEWFGFADATWRRTDDGADANSGTGGEAPQGWPMVGEMLYGYATLTDAEHLEYATDDGVIATYRRADGAPGCA